ncbi:MAG: hypothetical protein ACPG4U_15335, partial [Pseudomonadales bacterium]
MELITSQPNIAVYALLFATLLACCLFWAVRRKIKKLERQLTQAQEDAVTFKAQSQACSITASALTAKYGAIVNIEQHIVDLKRQAEQDMDALKHQAGVTLAQAQQDSTKIISTAIRTAEQITSDAETKVKELDVVYEELKAKVDGTLGVARE